MTAGTTHVVYCFSDKLLSQRRGVQPESSGQPQCNVTHSNLISLWLAGRYCLNPLHIGIVMVTYIIEADTLYLYLLVSS